MKDDMMSIAAGEDARSGCNLSKWIVESLRSESSDGIELDTLYVTF